MERHPRRWWALAATILAVFVDMIDNQIVTVALPTVQSRLGAGDAALQWISAGYSLGFALTLITGGRLGDRYGRKRLFVLGMAGFTTASLVAGLAPNVAVLIATRVVQGVFSGLMVPQVLSFIQAEFDDDERPKAMGWFAAAFPIGGLAGPLLGGLLTQANLLGSSWRAIFLVNVPVGVVAVVGALATLPSRPPTARERLDPVGVVLLTAALGTIFFPLVQGRELGWPPWLVGLAVAALPLLALFGHQQRLHAARGGAPLIPPGLLRYRSLMAGQAVMFAVNTASGVFFVLTLHLQVGLGYSPLTAALTFLPVTVGTIAGNVVAMQIGRRAKRLFIAGSVAALAVSLVVIAALVVWLGKGLSPLALALPAIGLGFGIGGALNSLLTTTLTEVGPDEAGAASGMVNTTGQLGTTTGIALFGTIFFSHLGAGFMTATAWALAVSVGVLAVALGLVAALPRPRTAVGRRSDPAGAPAAGPRN